MSPDPKRTESVAGYMILSSYGVVQVTVCKAIFQAKKFTVSNMPLVIEFSISHAPSITAEDINDN